jgi:serine protease Do
MKPTASRVFRSSLMLLGAAPLLVASCSRKSSDAAAENGRKPRSADAAAQTNPLPGASGELLANVASRVMPSVVSVASRRVARVETPELPFGDDPFFRRFFGPRGRFPFPMPPGAEREERGLGSGVIIGNGTILTNAHVVEGAQELEITGENRRVLKAKLVGMDTQSDLAVLKIEGDLSGLRPLEFADSSRVRLGQIVLAVGNPFGVGQTVTMGIVSATSRADLGIEAYEDFIQTDAAINPGNSGGALVDLEGKLVGVPTAILSRTGGYMGVGFAIPSNMAQPIVKSLLEHGRVDRGFLGVTIQNLDSDLANALGLKTPEGVLIADVAPGGPADRAGMRPGDVVLGIDGKPVQSTGQLRNVIASAGVGKIVKIEILRGGEKRTLSAKLDRLLAEKGVAGDSRPPADASTGLGLVALDSALRQKLGAPPTLNGVVVTGVKPGTPGARAGLREGDVIVEMDKKPVTNPADVARVYGESKNSIALLVWRDQHTFFAVMKR